MSLLRITEYSDPACPFAWSAEPQRRRVQWLFGDQIEWRVRMVGLARSGDEYTSKGFTPELQSSSSRALSQRHHMPIDTSLRPRMAATMPACRAVVAARLNAPEQEFALLRALRVRHFAGELLDEGSTLAGAAADVGIEPDQLEDWMEQPETEVALEGDLRAAREPTPEAIALSHKLARWQDGWRYTCPSYEIVRLSDGAHISAPGFQPLESYEVAIANLVPDAERRENPAAVDEVLAWAREPLATAEVAAVCALTLESAAAELGEVAVLRSIGEDGLWSLAEAATTA